MTGGAKMGSICLYSNRKSVFTLNMRRKDRNEMMDTEGFTELGGENTKQSPKMCSILLVMYKLKPSS